MSEMLFSFQDLCPFLIICPLAALAGFVDAVAGGGGLISLPAYLIAGVPPHLALGTNKVMSTLGTCVATWRYIRAGYVNASLAVCCIPFAFIGSFIGSTLVLYVSVSYLKILLLVLLPLTALFLSKKRALHEADGSSSFMRMLTAGVISSFLVGMYDGFYGPGTGVFLILAFTLFAHMKLTSANGLTKIINLTTNVSAACVFLWHDSVILSLGLTAALFNIAGNYLGSGFFKQNGAEGCRKIMMLVLVIFMLRVVYDLIIELV